MKKIIKKIAFLGDSITEGKYTSIKDGKMYTMSKTYCDVVGEALKVEIKNYGVSGTCISPNNKIFPNHAFVKRYANMDNDVDMVCVLGGTNDFGLDVPIGQFNDITETTFYGALNVLCEGLCRKYSGKTVVFITPLYRVCDKNINGNTLQEYRDAIAMIARERYGFNIIDGLLLGLDNKTENLKELLFDGLHPNPPAHEIIGKALASKLAAI